MDELHSAVGFNARKFCSADLLECLALQPGHIGDALVGRQSAIQHWRTLCDHPLAASTVGESPRPYKGSKIVAFGFDIPVATWFVEEELANPHAQINSRLFALIEQGKSPILSRDQVAKLNAKVGVDFLILSSACVKGIPKAQILELSSVLAPKYLAARSGFRIRRILIETVGPEEEVHFEATHLFRVVERFSEERCLRVSLHPEDTDMVSASFVSPLFHFRRPVLKLRESDQELLLAAMDGSTDEQLSETLTLTLAAVKKRWTAIYERTVYARPDLFPIGYKGEESGRGKQKRHLVLAYVRTHLEELRPFDYKQSPKQAVPAKVLL